MWFLTFVEIDSRWSFSSGWRQAGGGIPVCGGEDQQRQDNSATFEAERTNRAHVAAG